MSNDGDAARSSIVPADHMRRAIADRVVQWLDADPTRSVAANSHHAVRPDDVAKWAGRWDVVGLGDELRTTTEADEEPDAEQILTLGPTGAGFGDPDTNRLVEAAAVEVVTEHLESRGYDVTDV